MTDSNPSFATPYRTHTCGALRAADAGHTARLAGWVHRRRDHGQLIFLDLRDRYGMTQVVVDATEAPEAHAAASRLRTEFVVSVSGTVAARLPGSENPRLPTGAIELRADAVDLLAEARTPPFYINEPDAPIDEALRLRYRYLDIRREPMQERLLLRSRLVQAIREVHHAARLRRDRDAEPDQVDARRRPRLHRAVAPPAGHGLRPAPEPAAAQAAADGRRPRPLLPDRPLLPRRGRPGRPPARVHPARPGDELRRRGHGDRASSRTSRSRSRPRVVPERPILQVPFPRFTFAEAIERFGSDKPDLRFGMELCRPRPGCRSTSGFRVFDETLAGGGRVKAIVAPGMAGASRSQIDELTELARGWGAKGLVWLAVEADGSPRSSIAKFLGPERRRASVGPPERRPATWS